MAGPCFTLIPVPSIIVYSIILRVELYLNPDNTSFLLVLGLLLYCWYCYLCSASRELIIGRQPLVMSAAAEENASNLESELTGDSIKQSLSEHHLVLMRARLYRDLGLVLLFYMTYG